MPGASGVLYAGGAFTDAGGDAGADYLAKWSNGRWTRATSSPLVGAVNAVAYRNGKLYAGGNFINAGGNPNADFLAVWDGSKWGTVCNATGPAIGGSVFALQIVGSTIYVGGAFADAAGLADADALVACDLGTGAAKATVGPNLGFNGPVYALTADSNGALYAGGGFVDVAGIAAADKVARYAGGTWHALGSGPGPGGGALDTFVRSLAANGTNVYVGTDSLNIAGIPQADHVAKWNGTAWSALGANTSGKDGWIPTSATVDALTTSGSRVFVAGTFGNANGNPLADNIAEFDGSGWKTLGSNGKGDGALQANVRALTTFDGQLDAGGSFTSAGGNTLAAFAATFPLAGAPPAAAEAAAARRRPAEARPGRRRPERRPAPCS